VGDVRGYRRGRGRSGDSDERGKELLADDAPSFEVKGRKEEEMTNRNVSLGQFDVLERLEHLLDQRKVLDDESLDEEFPNDHRGSVVVELGVEEMVVAGVRVSPIVGDVGLKAKKEMTYQRTVREEERARE
jgi:hypothetical protein